MEFERILCGLGTTQLTPYVANDPILGWLIYTGQTSVMLKSSILIADGILRKRMYPEEGLKPFDAFFRENMRVSWRLHRFFSLTQFFADAKKSQYIHDGNASFRKLPHF